MKRIADKGKHTFFVRQKTAKPSSSLVPKSLPIYFYQQGNFFIFNKLYFKNYLALQVRFFRNPDWLCRDFAVNSEEAKFFCLQGIRQKNQKEGVSKCRWITWQLSNYKQFFSTTKKRPFLYSESSTEMVISIGLFQTVRLSKWYLHFDTSSYSILAKGLYGGYLFCKKQNKF